MTNFRKLSLNIQGGTSVKGRGRYASDIPSRISWNHAKHYIIIPFFGIQFFSSLVLRKTANNEG